MNHRTKRAFSMVELLVVIGIIALLISILLPVLGRARELMKRTACQNNLRQLALGVLMYADDNKGIAPCWGWEFSETRSNWSNPTQAQKDLGPEGGLIWKYAANRKVYVCPNQPESKKFPGGNRVWGFPPYWSYVINGQPGYSLRRPDWCPKIVQIKPSPRDVQMLMEQWAGDYHAFDNSVELYGATYVPGDDSLTDVHSNGGNVTYYDGHVEWKLRSFWLSERNTPEQTKRLFGGYVGFYW